MANLILSPHFDDAVLSCWHLIDGPDEVLVVNVFGGVPPADTTGWWDQAGDMAISAEVVEQRRVEDKRALALAGREAVNFDFLDDQYREGAQPIQPVVESLRSLLGPETSLWAPAGLAAATDAGHATTGSGQHPDHLVVRDAALALHAEGCPVTLYADLPHASARGLPPWVTGREDGDRAAVTACWRRCLADTPVDDADAEIHRLSEGVLTRKLKAVRRYTSQLVPLERGFGRRIDAPELLDHEVAWRLPSRPG